MSSEVTIAATTAVDPTEAFRRLADYARYPEHTTTVRSVEVFHRDGQAYSTWRVSFRGGVLCWTERDEAHTDGELRLSFVQVDGDLDRFDGGWTVLPHDTGSMVVFNAVLDLGIPSLAPLVDPIAKEALASNMRTIVDGLFDDAVFLSVDAILAPARR